MNWLVFFFKSIPCCIWSHDVSETDEEKLFGLATRKDMVAYCTRCKIPLLLKIDEKEEDTYTVTET
jgi:hypothetical protein